MSSHYTSKSFPRPLWRLLAHCAAWLGLTGAALAAITGTVGSSIPFNNAQPTLAVQWLIATQGVFPPRDGTLENSPYVGELRPFAFSSTTPTGWMPCDGRTLAITSYQALYSILGNRFGGDGRTTFALPDLRGRVPIGTGLSATLTSRSVGDAIGAETVTLTSTQLPTHAHSLTPTGTTTVAGSGGAFSSVQPSLALTMFLQTSGDFSSIGWVRFFAGSYVIGGGPACNGSELSTFEYETAFTVLGTTYGGDGTSTFAVPDLTGRTPIGAGQGAGLTARALATKGGSESVALTIASITAHSHSVIGGTTGSTGGGGAHDTMQPFLALNWSIAVTGQYGESSYEPSLGELRLWARPTVPDGWLACSGATLAIAQYQALFSLIGTAYGGNGVSTFAVPDARGRALAGIGTGSGLTTRALADAWGSESVTLVANNLPAHNHAYTPTTVAPTVTTTAAADVAITSATLGGDVTSDGGASVTERGIVWATTDNPTTADTKVQIGTGTGSFSQSVTGLSAGTTVYVRAYAINSIGTSYGSSITFTTLSDTTPPTIVSIVRQSPASQTSADGTTSFTFRVTYSEAVQNVTAAQFQVEAVNGSGVTGSVSSVSGTGTTRDVTVSISGGFGEFRLKPVN